MSTERSLKTKRKKQARNNSSANTAVNQSLSSLFELKTIKPLTIRQQRTFDAFDDNKHLILHGVAGTGKTYISLYLALDEIFQENPRYKKIIIVRSVVPTRDIGFLPGKITEKINIYELPYDNICNELFHTKFAYSQLKSKGIIEFQSTSFVRGLTFDDAIIIVDEMQNMTRMELHSILTRIGKNTRFIMCGDYRQDDLKDKKTEQSGLAEIMDVLNGIKSVQTIDFEIEDIVRSGFVKEYILERYKMGLS
jgi:hypothetical protein